MDIGLFIFPWTGSSLSVVSNLRKVSHVPQKSHADTFILPPIRDDEHEHAEYSLDESYDSEESDDSYSELV
jgi:hypothetical protein